MAYSLLLFFAAARAEDLSWQCPVAPAIPTDLWPWVGASTSLGEFRSAAYAWYDEACVTCVSEGWESDHGEYESSSTCEAIACVTSAGATIDYRSDSWQEGDSTSSRHTDTETLTVVPPADAGLGWTSLTYTSDEADLEMDPDYAY